MCEQAKCFTEKKRKARKQHFCCECRAIINKGDYYVYSSGIWDDPMSFKTCLNCDLVRSAIVKNINDKNENEFDFCDAAFGGMQEAFQSRICSSFKGSEALYWFSLKLGVPDYNINAIAKLV